MDLLDSAAVERESMDVDLLLFSLRFFEVEELRGFFVVCFFLAI